MGERGGYGAERRSKILVNNTRGRTPAFFLVNQEACMEIFSMRIASYPRIPSYTCELVPSISFTRVRCYSLRREEIDVTRHPVPSSSEPRKEVQPKLHNVLAETRVSAFLKDSFSRREQVSPP